MGKRGLQSKEAMGVSAHAETEADYWGYEVKKSHVF